jgi:hypothetical protein
VAVTLGPIRQWRLVVDGRLGKFCENSQACWLHTSSSRAVFRGSHHPPVWTNGSFPPPPKSVGQQRPLHAQVCCPILLLARGVTSEPSTIEEVSNDWSMVLMRAVTMVGKALDDAAVFDFPAGALFDHSRHLGP